MSDVIRLTTVMRITRSLNLGSDDRPGGRSLTKMRAVVQIFRLDGKKEK